MFEFDSYHVLMAAAGAVIIASYWLPRFFSGREPAAAPLLILTGFLAFAFLPGMPQAIDPVTNPRIWEVTAELAVIIGLFGTGLRIDKLFGHGLWTPTLRLLLLGMPITIVALAMFGWMAAGMTDSAAFLSTSLL